MFELNQSGVGWTSVGGHGALCERCGDAPAKALAVAIAKAQGRIQTLPAGGCGLKGLGGEIKRFAVVRLQHKQAKGHRRDSTVQQGADGGEVAERFGHLGATDIDHAVVHP